MIGIVVMVVVGLCVGLIMHEVSIGTEQALIGICVLYIVGIFFDCLAIKSSLGALAREERGSRSISRSYRQLLTLPGRMMSGQLEALQQRVRMLLWQANASTVQPEASLDEAIFELGVPGVLDKKSERGFYEQLLTKLASHFRGQMYLIAIDRKSESEAISERFVVSYDLSSRSSLDEKLCGWIIGSYEAFLSLGKECPFGLRDELERHELTTGFTISGLRHTLSEAFSFLDHQGRTVRGVLWVGYRPSHAPFQREIGWLQRIGRKLERELKATQHIYELSGKVAESRVKERQRSDFIAHVSHDIRSPLNNLRAILNLFQLEASDPENRELLTVALGNCTQMSEIVDDILDFSRHQAGELRARKERVDVRQCIKETLELHLISAKLKGLRVVQDFGAENLRLLALCDQKHLKRIIGNLLSNAIKYTRLGEIRVSLFVRAECQIVFQVKDTGIGMSQEQLKQLFVPFVRFHVGEADGVGLGLSLSKILLDLSGGQLRVTSQEGVGTTFEVVMPTAEIVQSPLDDKCWIEPAELKLTRAARVLIVDDNANTVISLARNLEHLGHHVFSCFTVADAEQCLKECRIDCIISDYQMPDGGAPRIIDFLTALNFQLPLLVLTGKEDGASTIQSVLRAQDSIVMKPCEVEVIDAWVRGVMTERVESSDKVSKLVA